MSSLQATRLSKVEQAKSGDGSACLSLVDWGAPRPFDRPVSLVILPVQFLVSTLIRLESPLHRYPTTLTQSSEMDASTAIKFSRKDGRSATDMRTVEIQIGPLPNADGSGAFSFGKILHVSTSWLPP